MAPQGPGRIDIAVCEKHGLRYNRSVERGCALCRREAAPGAAPPAPGATSSTAPPAPRSTTGPAPSPQPRPAAARAAAASPIPPAAPAAAPAAAGPARSGDIVVCEKHGLRYNRAAESGCVRCRRESGASTAATAGTTGATPRPSSQGAPASAPVQLLVAALLVGGTGALFWSVQNAVIESVTGSALVTAGQEGAEAAAAPGERKSFESIDPLDPSAIPTPEFDPRGYGPGEQQKQIHEFFEQEKEEAERERRAAQPVEPQ